MCLLWGLRRPRKGEERSRSVSCLCRGNTHSVFRSAAGPLSGGWVIFEPPRCDSSYLYTYRGKVRSVRAGGPKRTGCSPSSAGKERVREFYAIPEEIRGVRFGPGPKPFHVLTMEKGSRTPVHDDI
jgi:hypothetical protein